MHFDLHPSNRDLALGRDLTDEMVERFLAAVKPDYVQYDCKGHVGYLGYPSKVSTPASNIVKDSLEIWRRVTAAHGVGLFIHFSGVWDSLACEQHPEWARLTPEGKPDQRQTSTFGPYVDQRMIPQLKEAVEKYDLDGAWVDGECWATNPDYCEAAARAFRQATGVEALPKGPQDKGWLEFLELNREQFRKYVRHYIDVMHGFRPKFQIASNWLYSTFVPERPELPVDFLSGDYLGNASISQARLEARYMAATGQPWDLMAWGFQRGLNNAVGLIHKPAEQLEQEASVVLAQGGGFQIYYQPTRAGKIDGLHIGVMARVAKFCRARQEFSHKTEPVPQIGIVFSKRTLYNAANKLFGGWGAASNPAQGLMDALLECHYSVDVLPDWKLEEVIAKYPLVVAPDWSDLGEDVRRTVSRYVGQGGSAMVVGAENAALFEKELGVRLSGQPANQPAYVPGDEVFANCRGLWRDVELAGAKAVEERFPAYDSTRDAKIAATVAAFGKGRIAAIYGPIGSVFALTHAPATRRLVGRVASRLFAPMVSMEAPPTVEVALRRKGARMLLHLSNATAMQVAEEYAALDFVPSVGPLRITVNGRAPAGAVSWQPGDKPLAPVPSGSAWTVTIDRLHIHGALAWTA
jgi:hypothetical protein